MWYTRSYIQRLNTATISDDWHVIHSLLPPQTEHSYNLRWLTCDTLPPTSKDWTQLQSQMIDMWYTRSYLQRLNTATVSDDWHVLHSLLPPNTEHSNNLRWSKCDTLAPTSKHWTQQQSQMIDMWYTRSYLQRLNTATISDDRHVIHSLLPPKTKHSYNLRWLTCDTLAPTSKDWTQLQPQMIDMCYTRSYLQRLNIATISDADDMTTNLLQKTRTLNINIYYFIIRMLYKYSYWHILILWIIDR